jgi:hypothetical protein
MVGSDVSARHVGMDIEYSRISLVFPYNSTAQADRSESTPHCHSVKEETKQYERP